MSRLHTYVSLASCPTKSLGRAHLAGLGLELGGLPNNLSMFTGVRVCAQSEKRNWGVGGGRGVQDGVMADATSSSLGTQAKPVF